MKPTLVLGLALAANAMAADSSDNNELFVAPTGKLAEWAKQHPYVMFDEVADDELAVKYVHLPHLPAPEYVAYDAADDELLIRPLVPHIAAADDEFLVKLRTRDHFKTEEEYQKYYARARLTLDDAADDELAVKIVNLPAENENVAFDDELAIRPTPEQYGHISHPEKYDQPDQFGRVRPRIIVRYDEVADGEFTAAYIPRGSFPTEEAYRRYMRSYSEEADDELAYLGHLLNERVQPRSFDEFKKGEKLSHGKNKEKTQNKRKLRPIADEAPLARN